MQMNIDEKEKEFLVELLNQEHDFKEELKRRKLLAEKLLEKLGAKEKFA